MARVGKDVRRPPRSATHERANGIAGRRLEPLFWYRLAVLTMSVSPDMLEVYFWLA